MRVPLQFTAIVRPTTQLPGEGRLLRGSEYDILRFDRLVREKPNLDLTQAMFESETEVRSHQCHSDGYATTFILSAFFFAVRAHG